MPAELTFRKYTLHRADDVRYKFERYGFIRDIYLPKDHHTGCARHFSGMRDQARPRARARVPSNPRQSRARGAKQSSSSSSLSKSPTSRPKAKSKRTSRSSTCTAVARPSVCSGLSIELQPAD